MIVYEVRDRFPLITFWIDVQTKNAIQNNYQSAGMIKKQFTKLGRFRIV